MQRIIILLLSMKIYIMKYEWKQLLSIYVEKAWKTRSDILYVQ